MTTEPDAPAGSAPTGACTYCGNAYGLVDVTCPSCSFPTPHARTKAADDAQRLRLRTRLVAGVAAVAIVGASAFLLLGGDDEVPSASTGDSTDAPAGDPAGGPSGLEPSWDVQLDSRVLGELAVGDGVIVSIDSGDLVALDAQGDRSWSRAQLDSPVVALDAGGEVVVSADGRPGISANALSDGDELWRYPDITYVGVAESGIVVDVEAEGGPFGVLDATTGVPVWSVPDVDAYALAGAMAYVRRGPEVSALSTADGSVLWASDVGAGGKATLVANLELVAVVKAAEVVALDPLNGTERWTARARGAAVEVFSDELVLLTGARAIPPTAVAYDASGPRGEIPVQGKVPAGLVRFSVDGKPYVIEPRSGSVLDEALTVLATYDGTVTPAADGVYVVADDRVSHYILGSTTPDSEIVVPGAERVVAREGGFAVVAGDTVIGVG